MQFSTLLATLTFLSLPLAAVTLKLSPPAAANALKLPSSAASTVKSPPPPATKGNATATATDVAKLRKRLEGVALGLEAVVSKDKQGDSKIVPVLKPFLDELRATLDATASMKDAGAAMQKLTAAQAGMAVLTKSLSAQQADLMHENQAQETSLLLGVLMTRRSEPFAKQLEVLKSPDFANLPVSKELLAAHDQQTPLFQQVALYMDKHGQSGKDAVADRADRLAKSIKYFSNRVETLKTEEARLKKVHQASISKFQTYLKSGNKETSHRYGLMMRQSNRDYLKRVATLEQQTKMMENVVAAMKRGDTEALKKAEAALQAHMKAMKEQAGSFLHLLQLGHRLSQQDCPYCAAQCIDKCHSAGNPYTQCLTTCADAGK